MNPPYSEPLSPSSSPRLHCLLRRPAGDSWGDDVSPVLSDATGVRQTAMSGAEKTPLGPASLRHPLTGGPGAKRARATRDRELC